jgi:hypothetical protein
MPLPFVIDNVHHQLVDVLNQLLAQTERMPLDIATAYFSISGYRPLKDGLHRAASRGQRLRGVRASFRFSRRDMR